MSSLSRKKREKVEQVESSEGVSSWLKSLGMAHYTEAFLKAEVGVDVVVHLSIDDLKADSRLPLDTILDGVTKLFKAKSVKKRPLALGQRQRGVLKDKRSRAPPGQKKDSDSPLNQRSLVEMLEPRNSEGGKSRNSVGKHLTDWQLIQGTEGVSKVKSSHWFLTHFHSDHYGGLTKAFKKGTIFCSEVTSKLVMHKIKIDQERIQALPLNQPTEIDGTRVTFLDANHCPGSVMIIFERPGTRPVLHTGDARLTKATYDCKELNKLKDVGCVLILDTTYCNPKYSFPPQSEVVNYVGDVVMSEMVNPKTLFLFGTYGVGKERVFLEAAKRAGRKVYMSKDKLGLMECLDLSEEERELLTSDHEATNIHAVDMELVGMFKVSVEPMKEILKRYDGLYTSIVGFRPTGWSYVKGMEKVKCGRIRKNGQITIYEVIPASRLKKKILLNQVPYSEHSSFVELQEFVHWLKPSRIVPHVGNDGGPNLERMLGWLRQTRLD